jgi:beta-N-acetylhexosaminidase
MMGHLSFPQIDGEISSLSTVFQTGILRDELGFEGLIMSDDMNMGAVNDDKDRFEKAILAGTDMVIYVQSEARQRDEIENLVKLYSVNEELRNRVDESVAKILKMKCEFGVLDECL